MDAFKRQRLIDELIVKANEIIATKHVHIIWFLEMNTLYEYNCAIAKSPYYKKLDIFENRVLSIILKRQWERLDHWEDEYPITQEEKEKFWEDK